MFLTFYLHKIHIIVRQFGKPLQYLIKEFLLAYNMHYISDLYIKTHLMKEQIQTS